MSSRRDRRGAQEAPPGAGGGGALAHRWTREDASAAGKASAEARRLNPIPHRGPGEIRALPAEEQIRQAFGGEAPRILEDLQGKTSQKKIDAARAVHDRCTYGWRQLVAEIAGVSTTTCDRWRKARWRYDREPAQVPARTCARPGCGKTFQVRRPSDATLCCSFRCAALVRWARDSERHKKRTCLLPGCGKEFTPGRKSHPIPRYCSKKCGAHAKWAAKRAGPAAAATSPRRRAA